MITRFAPSPSGLLHLGHAYAALVASRWAKDAMNLRIEDIDHVVCKAHFTEAIIEDLHWLGIEYHPEITYQQPKVPIYQRSLQRLLKMGVLYPCFCSRSDIRRAQVARAPHGIGTRYPETCRDLSPDQVAEYQQQKKAFAYRLHSKKAVEITGSLQFMDYRFGTFQASLDILGDMVIARKDGLISYHLAVVCDDAHEGISLVTRGEDLLEMTHLHVVLQKLLGFATPDYLHHHLMLDDQGVRLAKRADSMAISAYREKGMTPDQVMDLFPRVSEDLPKV